MKRTPMLWVEFYYNIYFPLHIGLFVPMWCAYVMTKSDAAVSPV